MYIGFAQIKKLYVGAIAFVNFKIDLIQAFFDISKHLSQI